MVFRKNSLSRLIILHNRLSLLACWLALFFFYLSLLLTEEDSEFDVSLGSSVVFFSCKAEFNCGADGADVVGWTGGAAIGSSGSKWRTCISLGLSLNWSSYNVLRFGMQILRARARLLAVEILVPAEEIMLMLPTFFLPRFFCSLTFSVVLDFLFQKFFTDFGWSSLNIFC